METHCSDYSVMAGLIDLKFSGTINWTITSCFMVSAQKCMLLFKDVLYIKLACNTLSSIVALRHSRTYKVTSALIVQSHDDRGVCSLPVEGTLWTHWCFILVSSPDGHGASP